MEPDYWFHISIAVPHALITPEGHALTTCNRGLATTYHPHSPGDADNDHPGKSLFISSPPSTHFSYWGMDVPFPVLSAVGLLSCKKTCEHTRVLYLTNPAAQINWDFWNCLLWEFCCPCFTVSAAFLTRSNYNSKIFQNRWYKQMIWVTVVGLLSIGIPHYPNVG